MLSPFAPHISEELWERLGNSASLTQSDWPAYDDALTVDETAEMAVQVNGKLRGRIQASAGASDKELAAAALADESVAKSVGDKAVQRAIVVKGRLINLIVR